MCLVHILTPSQTAFKTRMINPVTTGQKEKHAVILIIFSMKNNHLTFQNPTLQLTHLHQSKLGVVGGRVTSTSFKTKS